ncbi:MAG: hypothetical protein AB7U98_01395 [Candidatus Nitrosocosmicus sp.]
MPDWKLIKDTWMKLIMIESFPIILRITIIRNLMFTSQAGGQGKMNILHVDDSVLEFLCISVNTLLK